MRYLFTFIFILVLASPVENSTFNKYFKSNKEMVSQKLNITAEGWR
jgi:hypothetical protein